MSFRARLYIGAVTATGAAAMIAAAALGGTWVRNNWPVFLLMAAGMILAERFVINLTVRHESISFSVIEVAMTIALLFAPSAPFVLATATGMLGGQAIRRRPLRKAAYNTAMYTVGAVAASLVFELMVSAGVGGPYRWVAALGGMAAFFCINQAMLGTVVALIEEQSFGRVLRLGGPTLASVWAGNVTFGMIAHYLLMTEPVAILLLVVPFGVSYTAYQAWIVSKSESQKMQDLYQVGSRLIGHLEAEGTLAGFLSASTQMFRAQGAEIVRVEQDGLMVWRDSGEQINCPLDSNAATTHQAIAAYISSRNWGSWMMAPLKDESGASGALILHDHVGPEGPADFPGKDQNLLEALANQVAVRMRNVALFESVSEERAKFSDIVGHTSDGIYQVGPDRRIMTWNPAMDAITGYTEQEAVGQMCFNMLRARDSQGTDLCSNGCPIIAAGVTCTHQDAEVEVLTKDGEARWISYSHSPILDSSGVMTSDVIVVRDITKQRAVQESKDDFLATVSHELRTPLTPIKGFLLTLLNQKSQLPKEQQDHFFEMMLRQTERLETLVQDLLDAATLESGALTVDLETVDVVKVASQTVEAYKHSNPERDFRFSSARKSSYALANTTRLEQVICNLVTNAIRYSSPGEPIEVIVREDAGETLVAVRDRGPGIARSDQEMIFERFYRAGHHLTREQGGTGLGLFISRQLAEAMGGRLSLSSKLGTGSTFSIHLRPVVSHAGTTEPVTRIIA